MGGNHQLNNGDGLQLEVEYIMTPFDSGSWCEFMSVFQLESRKEKVE